MQRLDVPRICDRVGVHIPYFAFSDLEKQSASAVRGSFIPEHQTGRERGSIAAAEILRHLATLGACAAAVEGASEPTYYLATKGRLIVLPRRERSQAAGAFQAQAEVIEQDKRFLATQSVVSSADVLAHFRCEYQVLPQPVFARTFKHYRAEPAANPESSPYREPIELDFEAPRGLSLTAHSRPLRPSRFAGHFLEYPAWPASVYVETVSRVVDKLFLHMLDREVDYSVARLDAEAFRLISGSDSLSFDVECVSASHILSHYIFSAQVRREDAVAAKVEMEVYL